MKRYRKYIKKSVIIVLAAALIVLIMFAVFKIGTGNTNKQDPEGVSLIESQDQKDVKAAVEKIRGLSETAVSEVTESTAEEEFNEAAETESEEVSEDSAAIAVDQFIAQYNAILDAGNVEGLSADEIASFRQIFSDTVFFGDSMAQAIAEYGISSEDRTVYLRGGTLDTILPYMEQVQNIYPARIVIWTGLNDCDRYLGDYDGYKKALADVINAAAAVCGAGNVYVCSMLPPSDELGAVRPDLALAPTFNACLQETAAACGVHYIDTTWIVRQSLYLDDGIHTNSTYYAVWARYLMLLMAE